MNVNLGEEEDEGGLMAQDDDEEEEEFDTEGENSVCFISLSYFESK